MSTLSELIQDRSRLDRRSIEWLHQLVGDWQVVSDLSFADLLLCIPMGEEDFLIVAHCRPSTGATVYYEDVVGRLIPAGRRRLLRQAMERGVPVRATEPRWIGAHAVREDAIPVIHDGQTIAVISRQANLGITRTSSRLELNYVEAADAICGMIARGEFPQPDSPRGSRRGAPRVGDGLLRLGLDGEVLYASPNALSCFHRLGIIGDLTGKVLAEAVTEVLEGSSSVEESLPLVLTGRAALRAEVEAHGVVVSFRAIPITENGQRRGAVLLCRDVTEVRRQELELLTKDATIREIHHRVKNNLQTVAAVLRLQARRSDNPEVRSALGDAIRRVSTIALVHDMLSQIIDEIVDFDTLFVRVLRLSADVAAGEGHVRTEVQGRFGEVPADDATALAVVLTELVTNAVQHGLGREGGTVVVSAERDGQALEVTVRDDGRGMEEGSVLGGLGTQIVSTLVRGELGGTIEWRPADGGGTEVVVRARIGDAR
ncbi:PAS domain-containing sensor histidine kinase [uncultured Georgenia sp.]|uniref:sensor histidine kinase n=1 Tax=uncultured Georgenia sp. TaxID=378209 RepID=UPI0026146BC2|nr:PAS domain-containing sensor histidine kinase [uncultured Georgenia sp.]HLV03804.1 histidine kinase N-terminal domain-containing protein [Actinomycetaceae bacterium]